MFERFTDSARRVVVLAQEESKLLNHGHIGTEHLLLGMLAEREGVAANALTDMGLTLESQREQVERTVGRGQLKQPTHVPFTPHAKKVLEDALRQALLLHHNHIGTEHLLLGLIKQEEDMATDVDHVLGVDTRSLRIRILGYVLATDLRTRNQEPRSSAVVQRDVDIARVALTQLQAELHDVQARETG